MLRVEVEEQAVVDVERVVAGAGALRREAQHRVGAVGVIVDEMLGRLQAQALPSAPSASRASA